MRNILTITVRSLGRGRYEARVGGYLLVVASSEPFLAAARTLLDHGWPGEASIVMRHAGHASASLISTIAQAAALTVEYGRDGRPRFRGWKAPQSVGPRAYVRFSDRVVGDTTITSTDAARGHIKPTPPTEIAS